MRPACISLALLPVALLALTAPTTHAEWRPNGSPVSAWAGAVLAPNSRGGVFAANGYPRPFTTLYQLNASGDSAMGWPLSGRELTPGLTILEHTTTAPVMMLPDGAGGTYVLTAEQIGYPGRGGFLWPVQFYVHRRTAAGDPASGWTSRGVLVSSPVIDHTFEVRHLPTMVADGRDGVLVAWLYHISTEFPDPPLWVQRISGSGARLWGGDGVLVHAGPGVCTLPTLLADDRGGAFVFWGQWDAPRTSLHVFGQHLTPSGQPLWPIDGRPVSSGAFDRMDQAAPADGGWVRQFYTPAIAATSDGVSGAILGWAASTGADLNVYATRVAQDGSLSWLGDRLLCEAEGEQASVANVGAGAVGSVFAWRDGRAGQDVSIRAQLVSRHGRTHWTRNGALVAEGPGDRGPFSLVSDGRQDYYFAWFDPRIGGQVFAQRMLGNGHRSTTWPRNGALVSTKASGDPNTSAHAIQLVRAGRGTAIAGWSDRTEGSLVMLLTPHGPAQGPAATPLGPVLSAVSDPTATGSFALLSVSPNPMVSAATLRFVLPEATSASFELFDLAGRRVWSRDVSALGAGEHVVPLADGRKLPSGVYLVRLTQGVRAVTRRVVVLQ